MLPQKVYEVLRWLIIVVSPALCTLLLNLNIPNAVYIVHVISEVTMFLGIIFGFSKVVNDRKNNG